ncbi:MAG: hypothetical protein AVDCRST_MAG42-2424, partial [uncultured Chthoniobacterales bacterium]
GACAAINADALVSCHSDGSEAQWRNPVADRKVRPRDVSTSLDM